LGHEPVDRLFFHFPGVRTDIRASLSLRAAGSMRFDPAAANPERGRFLSSLGIEERKCAAAKQVHGRRIVMAETCLGDEIVLADGILSAEASSPVSVTVADCMPIWILDPVIGVFGVLHSGWAGTGIIIEAVRAIERMGGRPGDMSVILGPCIGPCCYRVSPERAVSFMDAFGPEAAAYRDGSWRLDLAAANEGLLERAGVGAWMKAVACTACRHEYGSSRREGREGFTRMIAVAGTFAGTRIRS
jgi:polyphenol oxidase